jgi:hypothetical protein
MMVSMKITLFWDVMLCSQIVTNVFGERAASISNTSEERTVSTSVI